MTLIHTCHGHRRQCSPYLCRRTGRTMRRTVAQISPDGRVVLAQAAEHSPAVPPWSRAETGTVVCCPRPCWSSFGHCRPGCALRVGMVLEAALAGRSAQFVLRLHMHVRHAVAPPPKLRQMCHVTRRQLANGVASKKGAWATATPSGRLTKSSDL